MSETLTVPDLAISDKLLRLSFYKISLGESKNGRGESETFEDMIVSEIGARVGVSNSIASFQTLGHFDVLCLYPQNEPHQILYKGSQKGILHFSNILCVAYEIAPSVIIEKVKKRKTLAILAMSFCPKYLAKHGVRPEISKKYTQEDQIEIYHLTSFLPCEQILIIASDTIGSLLNTIQEIKKGLGNIILDYHSIISINKEVFKVNGSEIQAWNEAITFNRKPLILEWRAQLKYTGAEYEFLKILEKTKTKTKTSSIFSFESPCIRQYRPEFVCYPTASTWLGLLKSIREIRNESKDFLFSTQLRVLTEIGEQPDPNNKDGDIYQEWSRWENGILTEQECVSIVSNRGSWYAQHIIKALYSLENACHSPFSRFIIRKILPVAEELKLNSMTSNSS
jgi:hypothetical protein